MICKLNQWRLSNLDGHPTGRLASHLHTCGSCQEHHQRMLSLEKSLRTHARSAPSPILSANKRPKFILPLAALSLTTVAAILLFIQSNKAATPKADPGNQLISTNLPAATPKSPPPATEEPKQPAISRWSISKLDSFTQVTPLEDELAALRSDGLLGLETLVSIARRN